MKEQIIEFFQPSRGKVALALASPVLLPIFLIVEMFLLFLVLGASYSEFVELTQKSLQDYLDYLSTLTMSDLIYVYISETIIFYPVSCSLVAIYRLYRKGEIRAFRRNKATFLLIIVGLTILNPVALIQGYMFMPSFDEGREYRPQPKVEVVAIEPESPFYGYALKVGIK